MKLETILKAAVNSMVHGHHAPHCYSAWVQGKGYVNNGGLVHEHADYLRQLERSATSEIENIGFADHYGEPGYDKPAKGILFANWNSLPSKLGDILEKSGYAIEWSDEWATCECGAAVRTSADSYGWKKSYIILNECDLVCSDCIKNNLDEYETYLLNNAKHADTFDVDWESRGFVKFNKDSYENGFHPGQNDDPKTIVKLLPKDYDFLFTIPSVGQFDITFDCWIKPRVQD